MIEDDNSVQQPADPYIERIQKLKEKVEKRWRSWEVKLENDIKHWSADPRTLFGRSEFASSERWSFESLNDLSDEAQQTQAPFHKANLSHHLWRRIGKVRANNHKSIDVKTVEWGCRKSMMGAIYPDYQTLPQNQQWRLYKRFGRYLEQGWVLRMMEYFNPGLLLTVARFLTTKEYVSS